MWKHNFLSMFYKQYIEAVYPTYSRLVKRMQYASSEDWGEMEYKAQNILLHDWDLVNAQ